MFGSLFSIFCSDGGDQKPTSIASEDVTNLTECDFDTNCTALYLQIKNKNWSSVNQFLLTGYWSGGFFPDRDPPAKQATTWVTKYCRKDKKKKVVWTQLPIHAALIYGAPEGVIKCLISISKSTLRCADDRRMLPLHLAFMHGSSDMALGTVLDEFPEAVAVRDFKGRTPAECAEDGPNLKRGQIISTVLFYNKKSWEKKAAKAKNQQLEAVREALGNRNERISHLETALNLIKCREDQTRDSFSMVVSEIDKFKKWYEERESDSDAPAGQPLDEDFVKNVALKLDYLQAYAEELVVQQAQAKEDSEKTLNDLNAAWGENKNETDVPVRVFDDSAAKKAATAESKRRARVKRNKAREKAVAATPQPAAVAPVLGGLTEQEHSEDISSQTSLETGSTRKSKEVTPLISTRASSRNAPVALNEEKKEDTGSLISLKDNEASLVSITEASVESATNEAKDKLPSIREGKKEGSFSRIKAPSVMTKKVEAPVVSEKASMVLTKKKTTPLFVPMTPVVKASELETNKVESLVSIIKKQEKSHVAPKPVAAPKLKMELPVTPKKKKVAKDDDSLSIPSEFRDDDAEEKKEAQAPTEEPVEPDANRPVSTVSVPGALSDDDLTSGDEDTIERELQMAISEMTSLDMSETTTTSKASSKITRMLSFGKKLNKVTKKANKTTAALSTTKTLPPKYSSSRSVKSNSGRVLSNPKRVAPTM